MNSNRKVLVTGGTGMIGLNLSNRLADADDQVYYLCRPSADERKRWRLRHTGEIIDGDITDKESVRKAVRVSKPDVVFHLASTVFNSNSSSEHHFQVIVLGTLHLLEAMREYPGARLVCTGSTAEYGSGSNLNEESEVQPATILGAAKANATTLIQTFCRLHGLSATVLRLFAPYGPWESRRRLIPHTILSAMNGKDVEMTAGLQERDFVFIDDVLDALMLAAAAKNKSSGPGFNIFNIGSGAGTAVRDIVGQLLELMGNPVKAFMGTIPTRPDEIMKMSADISRARRELGWEPKVSLNDGLLKSIAWVRENNEYI